MHITIGKGLHVSGGSGGESSEPFLSIFNVKHFISFTLSQESAF